MYVTILHLSSDRMTANSRKQMILYDKQSTLLINLRVTETMVPTFIIQKQFWTILANLLTHV